MFDPVQWNLVVGWASMIAGAVSGALIGLRFHEETGLLIVRGTNAQLGTIQQVIDQLRERRDAKTRATGGGVSSAFASCR